LIVQTMRIRTVTAVLLAIERCESCDYS
jgi:hypothetical protein